MLNSESRQDWASVAASWIVFVVVILTPVFLIPVIDNFFVASKFLLMSLTALALFGLFGISSWIRNHITLTLSPFLPALSGFFLATLASIFLTGQFPVENLLGFGGMYLSFVLIAILGGSILSKAQARYIVPVFAASGSLLGLSTLLQVAVGLNSKLLNMVLPFNFAHNAQFSLTGSPLIATQVFAVTGAVVVANMLSTKKINWWNAGSVAIIAVGLLLSLWQLLPGQPGRPATLPFAANWSIAIDAMKSPRTALIGVGSDNFRSAYSQFMPAWMNSAQYSSVRFLQGSNVPFTLWVSGGLLSAGTWIWLVATIIKQFKKVKGDTLPLAVGMFVVLVCQLLLPANVPVVLLAGALLAGWSALSRHREARIHALAISVVDQNQPFSAHPRANKASMSIIVAIISVIVVGITYFLGRATVAAYYSMQALLATQENKAIDVYNYQRRATELNPYLDLYRSRYATVNIQVAVALGNKTDITDQEKEQVSQLIQQAIREARAATFINGADSANWLVLAQIYRQLVGVATDADQWTVSAYTQAILAAPNDPAVRLELGGVFMAQNQFSQAASLFQQVVQLKPDYANGYYNLANSMVKLNQLEAAKAAYNETLKLIPQDNENYVRVMEELDQVEKALATSSATKETESKSDINQQKTASESALTKDLSIFDENVTATPQDTVSPNQTPVQVENETQPVVNSDLNR